MDKNILSIDFEMMPKTSGMVRFSDRIVLYDNIGKPMTETINADILQFVGNLPKRLTFTIIIVCIDGRVEIDCNTRKLSAEAGGLLVLVPGTIAERIDIDMSSHLVVMAVPDQEYAPASSFQNATFSQKNFTSPISVCLDDDVLRIGIDSYLQLKNAIVSMGDKVTDDLVKAYILVMAGLAAVHIQKWTIEHPESKKRSKEKVLNNFLTNVEREHREFREVNYYAAKEGLSPKYFSKIIFEASGKRPLDWIRDSVILDAKEMIKSGDYTIGKICEILNFKPQSLFNKYFKDATGMTPLQYGREN